MSAHMPALDPEAFVQCPYEQNHKVRNKRLQIHLFECRKKNPAIAKKTKSCPYNAKHIVPKVELTFHKMTCPDRGIVDREILHETQREDIETDANWAPIVNHNLHSTENWNIDSSAEPFFLRKQHASVWSPPRQPTYEPGILDDCHRSAAAEATLLTQPPDTTITVPSLPMPPPDRPAGSLPSTMKQVGLGRGYIRVLATNGAAQSVIGKPRTATTSSAFNVDGLVGRPNIVSGGSEPSFPRLQPAISQSEGAVKWPRPSSAGSLSAASMASAASVDNSSQPVDEMKREERKLRKRLKEILKLQQEAANGKLLNSDQVRKVESRGQVEQQLRLLNERMPQPVNWE